MTEKYSNFDSPATDKYPIVPEITFVKNLNLKLSEIILGIALFVAIVVCITLAAVLASKDNKNVGPAPLKNPYQQICVSGPCLKSASYITQNMNLSVKPCDNFFQYACGGFKQHYPLDSETFSRSLYNDLYEDNELRIKKVLESPVERTDSWSAERKLKHFFASCTDTYRKDSLKGTPIITKILPHIGGWYVLGTFDDNSFNFQQALQKVNVDFWTTALFTFRVISDTWTKSNRMVLEVDYSGMSMYWFYYTSPYTEKYRTDFKKFMRTIGNYLVRDSNITIDNHTQTQRINQWMEDAYYIESQLANLTQHTHSSDDPHLDENRVTIGQLTQQTNNVIDFVAFFKYMFNNAGVSENTRIIVHEPEWINKMTAFIGGLGTNKNRMLNNYFVWRLLYRYAQQLSWDYIHANRDFYVDRFGVPQFLGTWRYCFLTMDRYLGDALGSEFIKTHFADKNKERAHEILGHVREAILSRIVDIKFMDAQTKALATAKMKSVLDKIGYPDFMMDKSHMDTLYSALTVDKDDYFENVLSLNKLLRSNMNKQLGSDDDKSEWYLRTYDTFMYYSNYWNELLVPAGLLQFPFYDHTLSNFTNFGTMGAVLAHYLIHSIDNVGGYYDTDGKYSRWWSNHTIEQYNKERMCTGYYFSNQTMGPFTVPGNPEPVTVPVNGVPYAPEGMAEISGVMAAYKAYKSWETKNGKEKQAPGFNLNNEQMFFLSFAQTYCFNRNDNTAYSNAVRGRVSEDIKVNAIMSQIEEFSTAYNCPADSKMNLKKRCNYY